MNNNLTRPLAFTIHSRLGLGSLSMCRSLCLSAFLLLCLASCGPDQQEQAVESDNQAAALLRESNRQILANDIEGAAKSLDEALKLVKDNPHLLLARADVYVTQGRHSQAIAMYDQADAAFEQAQIDEKIKPKRSFPEAAIGRAIAYQASGEMGKMRLELNEAEKRYQMRRKQLEDGDIKQVFQDAQESIVKTDGNLAYIRYLRGEEEQALADAQALLKQHPQNVWLQRLVEGMRTNIDGQILPVDLGD